MALRIDRRVREARNVRLWVQIAPHYDSLVFYHLQCKLFFIWCGADLVNGERTSKFKNKRFKTCVSW